MLPKPLTYAILLLITAVWAINFAATLLVPGYESDVYIHVIFMGTVGVVLGLGQRGKGGGDSTNEGSQDTTAGLPKLPRLPRDRS